LIGISVFNVKNINIRTGFLRSGIYRYFLKWLFGTVPIPGTGMQPFISDKWFNCKKNDF